MKGKTIYIIGAIIGVLGLFIAGMGAGMNDRPGLNGSGRSMGMIGIAISILGISLGLYGHSQTKKEKDK